MGCQFFSIIISCLLRVKIISLSPLEPLGKICFNSTEIRPSDRRKTVKTGKLDPALLKQLLERSPISDPRVVLGPAIGEDAAVLDPGKESPFYWVVTADPITFTTDEIGYYGVVVNMNDIATRALRRNFFSPPSSSPRRVGSSTGRRNLPSDPRRVPPIRHLPGRRTHGDHPWH